MEGDKKKVIVMHKKGKTPSNYLKIRVAMLLVRLRFMIASAHINHSFTLSTTNFNILACVDMTT